MTHISPWNFLPSKFLEGHTLNIVQNSKAWTTYWYLPLLIYRTHKHTYTQAHTNTAQPFVVMANEQNVQTPYNVQCDFSTPYFIVIQTQRIRQRNMVLNVTRQQVITPAPWLG